MNVQRFLPTDQRYGGELIVTRLSFVYKHFIDEVKS